jgi:ribosomal protein L10
MSETKQPYKQAKEGFAHFMLRNVPTTTLEEIRDTAATRGVSMRVVMLERLGVTDGLV